MGRHKKTAVVLLDCGFVSLMSATTIEMVTSGLPRSLNGKRARSPKRVYLTFFNVARCFWPKVCAQVSEYKTSSLFLYDSTVQT